MVEWIRFAQLLASHTQAKSVGQDDVLFGACLDLSSIGFAEFIMELEEEFGLGIDVDDLVASIKTAGQLHERSNRQG